VQHFRNLKVWEKAHALTLALYKSSKAFPRDEIYGLTSRIRGVAVSIGVNIAEGACRNGNVDFARFLQMAAGSASVLGVSLAPGARSEPAENPRLSAAFGGCC
jgi:four helix bundle protein